MDHVTPAGGIERIEKPWGYELLWARTDRYVGKVLFIRKGHKLSFQYHRVKDETIYLQSGEMLLTVQAQGAVAPITRSMKPGECCHIPPGVRHRMEAVEDCRVFEVSTTELDDVVRLEDSYGRVDAKDVPR